MLVDASEKTAFSLGLPHKRASYSDIFKNVCIIDSAFVGNLCISEDIRGVFRF